MKRVILCLAIASASLLAQAPAAAPQQQLNQAIPAPQVMERIQEAVLDDEPQMRLMGALPGVSCSPKPKTILLGRPDNFNPMGPEPMFLSPSAKALWGAKLVPFDYTGRDRVFAVSFNLGQCKLCGQREMTVELSIKRLTVGGGESNDKAYVYLSNGSNPPVAIGGVAAIEIWKGVPNNVTTKLVTFKIPLAALNTYIFGNNLAFLDVVVQDDTAVDYVKLTW